MSSVHEESGQANPLLQWIWAWALCSEEAFFSSSLPHKERDSKLKCSSSLFPWHCSTQLHGCLAGDRYVNEPRQLTLVWTGAVTSSDAESTEVVPASGRAVLSFHCSSLPAVFAAPVRDTPLPRLGLQRVSNYSHAVGFSPACFSPLGEVQTKEFCP